MTTTTNQSLLDLINTFDNTAKIAALRGIVHSAMAKAIGAIRQDIRNRKLAERNEEAAQIDLDQRNSYDEDARAPHDYANAMGFVSPVPPLKLASLYHAVYSATNNDLHTLTSSRWDEPLSLKSMLKFMADNARKPDPSLLQALADVIGCDIKTIESMDEINAQRERDQLVEATPEILHTFEGFGDNGYDSSFDELPAVERHQFGIKVVDALIKAQNQVLNRVLRSRRLTDLASIPILKDATTQAKSWVEAFEKDHEDEIREALDAGRNVRFLEDLRA